MTQINKLAPLIESQLPSYAYEKYPTFVSFITTYFEWLDEEDNYANFLNAFKVNMDIDQSNDNYVDQFLQEFVSGIPTFDLKISKNELVKYIKEFYISKGTEESFKFIFRILYNEDVNITYPREFILASSDNTYEGDFIMNITKDINKEYFINDNSIIYIFDKLSGLRAFVDELHEKIDVLGNHYYQAFLSSFDHGLYNQLNMELKLQIDDIVYNTEVIRSINDIRIDDGGIAFNVGNDIYIDTNLTNGNSHFFAKITSVTKGGIEEIKIDSPGNNYVVGDYIEIVNKHLTKGYGFNAMVREVGGSGGVLSVDMSNGGFDYEDEQQGYISSNFSEITPTLPASFSLKGDGLGSIKRFQIQNAGIVYDEDSIVLKTTGGRDETLTPIFSNIFDTPKITTNQKGFTSHNNVLTDSWYYQQFSYLVSSYEQPNQWKHIVKSLLHPTGLVQFNKWIYESESLNDDIIGFTGGETIVTLIINVLSEAMEHFLIGVDGSYIQDQFYIGDPNYLMVGHNLRDLDSEKFLTYFNWSISEWDDESIDSVLNGKPIELNSINESYISPMQGRPRGFTGQQIKAILTRQEK